MEGRPLAIVFAHRGAPAERPENTLVSFRRALELGADALETDVHLTADGAVVTIHDAHGGRVAGVERSIESSSLSEIRSWDAGYVFVDARGERPFVGQGVKIPTLDEVLGELPKVRVNVDLKDEKPALARRFLEIVRHHSAEERVVAASFSRKPLRALREAGFRGEMSLARIDFLETWLVPRVFQRRRPSGTRAQIPTHAGPLRVDTPRVIGKLHELGLAIDFWTVNEPEEATRLVSLGADGIMTDDPARIVPALRARP